MSNFPNSIFPTLTFTGIGTNNQPFSYEFIIAPEDIQPANAQSGAYTVKDKSARSLLQFGFGQEAASITLYPTCLLELTDAVIANLRKFQKDQISALVASQPVSYLNANLHGIRLQNGVLTSVSPGPCVKVSNIFYYDLIRVQVQSTSVNWN